MGDRRVPDALRVKGPYVKWSEALGRRICERLAAGELLGPMCREPGMPSAEAVAKWARTKARFGAELAWARRVGGRSAHRRWSAETICAEVGQAIFERLCDGESLTAVCADPLMPSQATVSRWRNRFAEFETLLQLGMRVRAERLVDESWEMALAATPQTAHVIRVRLAHLRWMAGVMAPRQFHTQRVAPAGPREETAVLFRRFEVEVDPATGAQKVVAYCPNPETGEVEREDAPGWRPPPGAIRLPG